MSEIRQDLVSGDWIIMAPGRARRPRDFAKGKKPRHPAPKKGCPFENLKKSGNWPPILSYPDAERWQIVAIPNKYPALVHRPTCATLLHRGPYTLTGGIGHHELVVTRWHTKNFSDLSLEDATQVLLLLQERYRMFAKDKCLKYASTFFNWGLSAGASIYHPHYQLLVLPIIPPDIAHSLAGSAHYFKQHKKCVHCVMLKAEKHERKRVIKESTRGIAITPFVSRQPFEIRIFPTRHLPYFELTPAADVQAVAQLLQESLRRIKKHLHDPDFNFFIHTAPLKDRHDYIHYHWHVEILPKISTLGGLELGTGVDINVVDPDRAAQIFRGKLS